MAWDSAIREFEIIGETTNRLIKARLLDEESRVVVDFRNLLIHNYFGIDEEEVWDVIVRDLPIYKETITQAISHIDTTLKNQLISEIVGENSHLDFICEFLKKQR